MSAALSDPTVLPAPDVAYRLLSPMLIVFGAARLLFDVPIQPTSWWQLAAVFVLTLTAFCFYRVLTLPPMEAEEHLKAPLDIDNPSWVEDDQFDIDRHIFRANLPAPRDRAKSS